MGSITLTSVGEYRLGTVGGVLYGVELKLVDVPDLDLVVSRDGRGEVRLINYWIIKFIGIFCLIENTRAKKFFI
ncbi:hypothetical protein Smp_119730 [Schistosoma mansoni]|uniref:hypothetical protein n=1 Tax=Schistosoma mansoni TaxID=6183 RepID=UPI00022C87A0|nr:hypothetical protein Smp_119730 [Schistosoma mansoni]|eukprot:XP_018644608.1 hypothetical protein Smp_119730 [Schistosoma mansoni]